MKLRTSPSQLGDPPLQHHLVGFLNSDKHNAEPVVRSGIRYSSEGFEDLAFVCYLYSHLCSC
jgi:hypothetical protein